MIAESDHKPSHPQISPGQVLADARKSWGLSIEDVAKELHLYKDVITAIENDDHVSLPGYTFSKGYVRAYASLLKLDVEALVSMVAVDPENVINMPSSDKSYGKLTTRKKVTRRKTTFFRSFFKTVILWVFIIFMGLFAFSQFGKFDKVELYQLFKIPISDTFDEKPLVDIAVTTPSSSEKVDSVADTVKD